jgi:hypothetical protein
MNNHLQSSHELHPVARAIRRGGLLFATMLALLLVATPAAAQDDDRDRDGPTTVQETRLGTQPDQADTGPNDHASAQQALKQVTTLPSTGSGEATRESDDRDWTLVGVVVAVAIASLVIGPRRSTGRRV